MSSPFIENDHVLEDILKEHPTSDSSHGKAHIDRVWNQIVAFLEKDPLLKDQIDVGVLRVATYLHDLVNLPKNHPQSHQSAALSADKAVELLKEKGYPKEKCDKVHHAILAHSFSGGVTPQTLEAKLLQDADRLDALGAIGIARCFYTGGRLQTDLYHVDDPRGENRALDDKQYSLDHFEVKLFKLPDLFQTEVGKTEALERVIFMKTFLIQFFKEVQKMD